jgi:hypothetical protein
MDFCFATSPLSQGSPVKTVFGKSASPGFPQSPTVIAITVPPAEKIFIKIASADAEFFRFPLNNHPHSEKNFLEGGFRR